MAESNSEQVSLQTPPERPAVLHDGKTQKSGVIRRTTARLTGWLQAAKRGDEAAAHKSLQELGERRIGEQIALPSTTHGTYGGVHTFESLPDEKKERYRRVGEQFAQSSQAINREGPNVTNPHPGLTEDEVAALGKDAARYMARKEQEGGDIVEAQYNLAMHREDIPPEVGMYFDAHGIMRGGMEGDIRLLNDLLRKGIDPGRSFYSARLRDYPDVEAAHAAGVGASGPFATGNFVVIGHPGHYINERGVAGVIVNEPYYEAIPKLTDTFPNVRFIKAEDLDKDGSPGPLQEMIAASEQET